MKKLTIQFANGEIKTFITNNKSTIEKLESLNLWNTNTFGWAKHRGVFSDENIRKWLSDYLNYSYELKEVRLFSVLSVKIVSIEKVDGRTKEAKKLQEELTWFNVGELMNL